MGISCDYLVIGSGAVAMAFVDTILTETEASVVMVDRRAVPGGHWNDSYPFVRLHQPASSYGVASKPLGRDRLETTGLNAGMYELSSGVEIANYYHELMADVFLPSGRVTYLPMHEYGGDGTAVALLSGASLTVDYTTLVDATFLTTNVPSTHTRKFEEEPGVACIAPNQLPHLAAEHKHITVLGGGKTGCDALNWLLTNGYPADGLSWVVPRDSWFWNRRTLQPGVEFFEPVFGGIAAQYEAMADVESVEEFCLEMERVDRWFRLDENIMPSMFHAATLSRAELDSLRTVPDVIRGSRVRRIESNALVLEEGTIDADPGTLYVDCTASAVEQNVGDLTPVFDQGRINLQMIRQFQPCFSAALVAFIEATIEDQADRAAMARPTPMTDTPADYLRGAINGISNQASWTQDERVAAWLADCRLDAVAGRIRDVAPDDADKWATLARVVEAAPRAVANLQQLMAPAD